MRTWIAAATGLALGLRLWGLGADSLWADEAFTWEVTTLPWREVAAAAGDTNCPGYYLLAKASTALLGDGEAALRLPAALLMAAAVPFIALLALRIAGPAAAVVAAFVAALAPALLHYGQEARAYALLVFASAATLVAFSRIVPMDAGSPRPRARHVVALGLAAAALLYAHPYGILEAAGLGLVVIARWIAERRCPRAALLGLAVAGALFAPFAPTLLLRAKYVAASSWMPPASLEAAARVPGNMLYLGRGGHVHALFGAVVVVACARLPRPWRRLALVLAFACWIGPVLHSLLGSPMFVDRYSLGLAPLAVAAVGGLVPLAARGRPRRGLVAGAVLLGLMAAAAARYEATRPHRPDWRAAFAELKRAREGGATPVVVAYGTVRLTAYYFGEPAAMIGRRLRGPFPEPLEPLPPGRIAIVAAPTDRDTILAAAKGRPILREMPRKTRYDRLVLEIGATP